MIGAVPAGLSPIRTYLLASTADVTSTAKVPVSSLKSMKYRTIVLYLFDTALVVWVKESKVCACVGCWLVRGRVCGWAG